MKIIQTAIEGLLEVIPNVFNDDRGYFFESYNAKKVEGLIAANWVQDNESKSSKGVLRGLHYQIGDMAQAKLVRAVVGTIFDVAVDIRPESPTYGQYHGVILDDQEKRQFYIPKGFAHGFLVLSDEAIFGYKCDNYYSKEHEGGIVYNDPTLQINWPELDMAYLLSAKDIDQPLLGHHKPFIE